MRDFFYVFPCIIEQLPTVSAIEIIYGIRCNSLLHQNEVIARKSLDFRGNPEIKKINI